MDRMSKEEELLIAALAAAAPSIGRWIAGLIDGDDSSPLQTRRVRDILPMKSASQLAAEQLQATLDLSQP